MSNEIQDEPAGNTKSAGQGQLYRWVFTLKRRYETETPDQLWGLLSSITKFFIFQLEKGNDTGYIHYQGCFSLKTKHRLSEVKNLIGRNDVHLEPAKDWFASIAYCSKAESRIDGPWDSHFKWVTLLPEISLKDWQLSLLALLREQPHKRHIIWYYDPKGGAGKTDITRRLCLTRNDVFVCNNAKFSDIAFAVNHDCKVVIFDIPKAFKNYVNYAALECLKNGLIFSAKYKSGLKVFDPPHVIVMCNFLPQYDEMAEDRFDVIELSKDI